MVLSGVITREDVIIAMPFYNPLVMVRVQGRYLLEALEWSVARYDTNLVVGRGEFLQVSGRIIFLYFFLGGGGGGGFL